MNYRDALDNLYSLTDYEKKGFAAYAPEFYDLDRVRRLLAMLGHPQRAFQVVHIAGTKGKGSTAAMVEAVLRAAGHCTGLYTSPHLHSFRERMRASGELITEAEVVRLVEEMQPLLPQVADITTFEAMTALAFAWFARQEVEWAVVEVGLGGRLDATNVVHPALAIITSLSLDHTAILGDTLAQIATEKAGIIKPGVPVVSAPQAAEALAVIETTCQRQTAPLTLVGRDWTWEAGRADLQGQAFTVRRGGQAPVKQWIPLLGAHQLLNATTAVAALELLRETGVELPAGAIREGLRTVQWPGRLEILGRDPFVVVDSAHNGESARQLVAALRTTFRFRHLWLVVGASLDHATPELMAAFLAAADRVVVTQSRHPRAATPAQLLARAKGMEGQVWLRETVAEALELALAQAAPEDLICCTGSVFVAAEAREAWFFRQGLPLPPRDPERP